MVKDVILCFFGDMFWVLGFEKSLFEVRGVGGDVCFLYFFMEVVKIV